MAYDVGVYVQDARLGRIDVVRSALVEAASSAAGYTYLEAAVAYASNKGVGLLARSLASPDWASAEKRFLVSIDFGTTEPSALASLARLPNAQVRIPNARDVLSSPALLPHFTFHPKSYLFRSASWSGATALLSGSANLTASALATGSEVVLRHSWTAQTRGAAPHLVVARGYLEWFDEAWASASPLSAVVAEYRARRRRLKRRWVPEDRTPASRAYLAPAAGDVISPVQALQMANAKALWIRAESLYENRGPGESGNQLDTPRGTRVFFGFPATRVSRNTRFGYVEIEAVGHQAVSRSVRFGDNSMDKVNLPIPGRDGPASYDNAYLIFERAGAGSSGLQRFRLTVTDARGLASRIAVAANHVDLSMASGRQYGLLF